MHITYEILEETKDSLLINFKLNFVEFTLVINYEDIEILGVFLENFDLLLENYDNLHERFGRTFWSTSTSKYTFDLTHNSAMKITFYLENGSIKIIIKKLEDLKCMYNCLKEIYNNMDKKNILNRYNIVFS